MNIDQINRSYGAADAVSLDRGVARVGGREVIRSVIVIKRSSTKQ